MENCDQYGQRDFRLTATMQESKPIRWPENLSRVPYSVYADKQVRAAEEGQIFQGDTWNYLCLDVELDEPGNYRTTLIGETPVVVVRDNDGEVYAFENRCAQTARP